MMKIATSALLAAGLMLTAASAQEYGSGPGYDTPPPPPPDYGPSDDNYGPPPPEAYGPPSENVIVALPPYRTLNGEIPAEATHLSVAVSYHDLDLRSEQGAYELRVRVRDAAHDVCDRLTARFRYALTTTERCYRDAASGGLNRANVAISNARHYAYYEGYGR
jgi:UrcA family protein